MMPRVLRLAALALALVAAPAVAQSWRLRFDASAQRVSFRGLVEDSIPEVTAVTAATGGMESPDGYAVDCIGDGWCRYFRSGPLLSGTPASAGTDLTMWGLGVTGLSVHMSGRLLTDLTGDRLWPGTSPTFRLIEGYAEYVRGGLTARAGRMVEEGRLASAGMSGLDGLRASWRGDASGLEVAGYAGWGMARGTLLDVTSPAVNPLLDYAPKFRQIVVGALAGVHRPLFDANIEYRRELDPLTDYLVSERAATSLQVHPEGHLRLTAGADYDIAQGAWGSADASAAWSGRRVWLTLGARHYRPFFDLWTVWGVFSPVPYNGVNGSIAVNPLSTLQLRGTGEWFKYDYAGVSTPQVDLEDRGWRWSVDGTWTPRPAWSVDAGGHAEFLPGASSKGIDGRLTWRPRGWLDLAVEGGNLQRPLELRFQDAGVSWAGAAANYRAGDLWGFGFTVDRYWESRSRPDASGIDWNQWRASARISLTLRSAADRWLPPARPAGGSR